MSLVLTREERHALRRAVSLLDLDRGRFALSVLAGAAGLGSAVALSASAAWLIARASQMPDVVALGVAPVAVRLFGISRAVLRYCERLVSHDTALRGMNALRTRLYEILAAARTDTVAGLRRGDVLARVGADVDSVGDLVVRSYLPIAVAIVVGASTSLGIALVQWQAGLILALCLLVSGVVGPLVTIRAARAAELARQQQATDLSATVLTVLEGGAELSVSGRMPEVMAELGRAEDRLTAARDSAARPAAVAAAIDVAAMGAAVIGALLVGIPAVRDGSLAPVLLAVTVLVPLSAFEASSALAPACVQLITSAGAARRVVALVESAEATTAQPASAVVLPDPGPGGPRLVARDLAVGWPGGPVVADGIDLELAPGRRLAIVGPSGIGKTTLLLTLAGLLEPRGGSLSLDGEPPWGAQRSDVAERITLTAEDAHVFHTTILENLRVSRGDLSREEAVGLLSAAGLGSWLAGLPAGLDTVLGPDGTTVSGGERRRLLLARALATPAPLLALDEPGEHLDAPTADRLVADLLDAGAPSGGPAVDGGAAVEDGAAPAGARADGEAAGARGVLLVTHRLSALGHADEVLVMGRRRDDGPATVLRRGSHAELIAQDESYRWSLAQEDDEDD